MPKYVVKRGHQNALWAGEVVKETSKFFFTGRIEDCPFSSLINERFDKEDVVFETDDVAQVRRIMSIYLLLYRQHEAVKKSNDQAFTAAVDTLANVKNVKKAKKEAVGHDAG